MARMKKQSFIKGATVELRLFGREHVTQEYISWFNDPEVTEYNRHGSTKYTLERALEYLEEMQHSSGSIVFAIIAKDANRHVGNISLQNINPKNQSAEYAIIIGDKEYWGKGIAKEASVLILKHGFKELNLHRIYCGTPVKNIPMQKLAASLGFVQEGIRKDAMFKNGEFVDVIEYGLLKRKFISERV